MLSFVIQNWYLFVALAVVVALLVSEPLRAKALGIETIGPARAIQLVNREAGLFLDVRENNEWSAGHIPKARHIPLGALANRTIELEKQKNRPVVVYCRTGARSARAAAVLRKQGFASVFNLAGGFSYWQQENLPSERG